MTYDRIAPPLPFQSASQTPFPLLLLSPLSLALPSCGRLLQAWEGVVQATKAEGGLGIPVGSTLRSHRGWAVILSRSDSQMIRVFCNTVCGKQQAAVFREASVPTLKI